MKPHHFFIGLAAISFNLSAAQNRYISAGGSITEIMHKLGLGDQIIAVDSSSYYPPEAFAKPHVGYFRRLSAEGVLSTNPTHLIASNGAGPDEALQQINNAGVEVKVFKQEVYTLESWQQYLLEVGMYFNAKEQAQQIIADVTSQLASMKRSGEKRTGVFLMDVGDRGPVAAGQNTVPNMLMKLAHINNIVNEFEGFKPYSAERLIQIKPELIIMPSHVVERMGGEEKICQNLTIAMTTADRGCDILVLDALLALGFGTRIDDAVKVLVNHEYQP
ncbi:MAG: heme/hemin ABC transporter substrate-binding protein [Marinicella sp.]